ncbi:MAG: PD40 domain-containing protein [Gemmatimonadetes bacterium]|nr:PD40 domain-containing protein [Gemmatimonadota bacterium]
MRREVCGAGGAANGARIAFERLSLPEQTDVYVWSTVDKTERNLSNDARAEGINREPSWSPNRRKIVFP